MALQFDEIIRNLQLDSIESSTGPSAVLKLRTGAKPANVAAADSGTVIATMTLPSDWMAAASGGTKSLLGTWQDLVADATGTVGHFRIYTSGGTVAKIQGSCGESLTDMIIDNEDVNAGQTINVVSFTLTAGNA